MKMNYSQKKKKSRKKGQNRSLFRRKYDFGKGLCAYCLQPVPYSLITKDHIQPRSRGGSLTIENVVPACFGCNQKKADKIVGWEPKIDYTEFNKQLEDERSRWKRQTPSNQNIVVESQLVLQL